MFPADCESPGELTEFHRGLGGRSPQDEWQRFVDLALGGPDTEHRKKAGKGTRKGRLLGPPAIGALSLFPFFWGMVRLPKWTAEKKGHPYSNLSNWRT